MTADTIVTFVNLTNQNPGFTINVQFLNKVGEACQQGQGSQWIIHLCGLLHMQNMGHI